MNAPKITYFTLERIQVGEDWREPGDLLPEAAEWSLIGSYIAQGKIAPVLVATLPQHVQDALAALGTDDPQSVPGATGEEDEDESTEDDDEPEDDGTEVTADEDGESEDGDDEEVIDYNEFTVPELKAELDAREVEHPSSALKADLVALLEANDAEAPDDDDE
jgi:hypothetical protein